MKNNNNNNNNNNDNIKLQEPTLSFFKINSSETAGVLKTRKYVDEFFIAIS